MTALEVLKKQVFELREQVRFAIKRGDDTGIVLQIIICPEHLLYKVVWSDKREEFHYDFELKKFEDK